jgi:hypothetical protein
MCPDSEAAKAVADGLVRQRPTSNSAHASGILSTRNMAYPDVKFQVLMPNLLNVEPDGRNGLFECSQLQLV